MVKYDQFLRAFNAKAQSGYCRVGNTFDPVSGLGQNPFRSPSVFNFFRPDYAPPGSMLNAGLNAPEFQITHETTVVANANFLDGAVRRAVNSNPDTMVPDYSGFVADSTNPDKLVDRLNLLLTYNTMSPATRAEIVAAVKAMPSVSDNDKLNRVRTAVFLTLASPDYVVQK